MLQIPDPESVDVLMCERAAWGDPALGPLTVISVRVVSVPVSSQFETSDVAGVRDLIGPARQDPAMETFSISHRGRCDIGLVCIPCLTALIDQGPAARSFAAIVLTLDFRNNLVG